MANLKTKDSAPNGSKIALP